MGECVVDGCCRKIDHKDTKMCHMHHLRFIRYGTTDLSRNNVQHDKKCIVDGCERLQETNMGCCLMHYKRYKRTGTFDLHKRERSKCLICGDPSVAHQLCRKHYMNLLRHDDPEYSDNAKNGLNQFGYRKIQGEKYKVEHRVIAEKKIGRELKDGEVVHHIDLDKTNNDESNLFVCSKSQHSKLHHELERCGAKLLKAGLIEFKDGHYVIKE